MLNRFFLSFFVVFFLAFSFDIHIDEASHHEQCTKCLVQLSLINLIHSNPNIKLNPLFYRDQVNDFKLHFSPLFTKDVIRAPPLIS